LGSIAVSSQSLGIYRRLSENPTFSQESLFEERLISKNMSKPWRSLSEDN
jgi:hypothetical protein